MISVSRIKTIKYKIVCCAITFGMFKCLLKMSGNISQRLKSVIVVPKHSSFKVIDEKDILLKRLKSASHSKRKTYSTEANGDNENESRYQRDKKPKHKKNWPSIESLLRHANYRPLGVNDDWGPLSHKHELMPMDNIRYWHQHRCETCHKLFEHKHKQRGDQSMNYNQHICNVCGGTAGSRRVISKRDFRKQK